MPFEDNKYRWVEVAPEGGETTIAIAPPPPGGSTGDVDAEVSRMGEPVPPMFWFRDPEDNVLMVVEA